MNNKYDFSILLVIAMFMATFIYTEVNLFFATVFFICTSIPGLILYYLFYVKKIEFYLKFILLVIFGYSLATLASLIINETYISIVMISAVSISILVSFLYKLDRRRKGSS